MLQIDKYILDLPIRIYNNDRNSRKHRLQRIEEMTRRQDEIIIDEIDTKILRTLIEDSRISYSDLSKTIGLSRARIKHRIVELQENGVIEKFTILVPSKYLARPLPVFFDVHVAPDKLQAAAKRLSDHPDISIIYQMSGNNTLHVHGFFGDMEKVAEFTNEYLPQIKGVVSINTEFLIRRYKIERSLMV